MIEGEKVRGAVKSCAYLTNVAEIEFQINAIIGANYL